VDRVIEALSQLTGQTVRRGELVRTPGRRLRWIDVGEGPTVVLVAGSAETCLNWAPVLPRLTRRFRVVAYDRAGSGDSDRTDRLSISAEVDDLVALLDRVGSSIVVGHSWGGLLAQLAATRRPEAVRGLVLEDATHEDVLKRAPLWMKLAERGMGIGVMAAYRLGLFGRLAARSARHLAEHSSDDAGVRELLVRAYMDSYATRSQVSMIRDEAALSDRGIAELRRWRATHRLPDVPLIALSATDKPAKLREMCLGHAEDVCAELPRARHIVVDRAGHYIHRDRPDAVAAAVDRVARPADQ
jgi:pimeloyl-ACP methyl ester carboxylesterase